MLEVRLLGKLELRHNGETIVIASRPAQSLFAYLILTAGTAHRREKLAGLLWPDSLEETARDNLRHALWRVRKALHTASGKHFIQANDVAIGFNSSADYRLDAAELEKLSENASIDELIAVLSEYHGELLPGFYDEWVLLEREHLNSLFEHHMARLLSLLQAENRWLDVLDWGERWIKLGQKPEPAYRALMSAHAAKGDMAKVVATYERCVKSMREIGIEPSEQTRVLYGSLKIGRETFDTGPAMPENEKRFESPKTNLPVPLTSFIGREREIEKVRHLLSTTRLLTLTGSGGIGKTRLAIQAVHEVLGSFKDGVWWVELAPLTDAALVPRAVAQVLGVHESPDQSITESVQSFLQEKRALLILDNCEHLLVTCAQLAVDLLSQCANLRLMTTSREVLGLMGEATFQVPPLSSPALPNLPPMQTWNEFESVQLFIERAEAVHPDLRLTQHSAFAVTQICRQLDGIPLAIELAAARVKMMSVEEIANRLDARFDILTAGNRTALPRHQTLSGLIDWSYDLLSEPERALLRRLAVFVGGWTMRAAESVCADDLLDKAQVFELLSRLVDKSLVMADERDGDARYRMLETIRQYAHAKMLESENSERLNDLHLEFFLDFSEQTEPHLLSAGAAVWIDRIQSEWDNIRFAIRWSLKRDRGEQGLRIANGLLFFAHSRGYLREFSEILADLLQSQEAGARTPALGRGFFGLASAKSELGDYKTAYSLYEKSVEILRETGEEGRDALETVLAIFANALQWSNAPAAARYAQEAVQLCRESGNRDGLANALMRLGEARIWMNEGKDARLLLEESAMLAQEVGNQVYYAVASLNLGILSFYEGKLDAAKSDLEQVKSLGFKTSFRPIPALVNLFLGAIARIEGRQADADFLLQESILSLRELGLKRFTAWALMHMGRLEHDRSNFHAAQTSFREAFRLVREANIWNIGPQLLESFAYLNFSINRPHRAVQFLSAAATSREELGIPLLPIELGDYESCLSILHGVLDQESFDTAWQEGRAMSLPGGIALALEET